MELKLIMRKLDLKLMKAAVKAIVSILNIILY